MPKLILKYKEVIEILEANGFSFFRQGKGSHMHYKGEVNGAVRIVQLSPHKLSEVVPQGTLGSIIRQSGLPKSLFRK